MATATAILEAIAADERAWRPQQSAVAALTSANANAESTLTDDVAAAALTDAAPLLTNATFATAALLTAHATFAATAALTPAAAVAAATALSATAGN